MEDYEKLEYIHCALQELERLTESYPELPVDVVEIIQGHLESSTILVEELREKFFDANGNLKE